ncbi:MAG: GNAT family N-acetyltransferase [Bacteroidota bacterium]
MLEIQIKKVSLSEILALRSLYLQECKFQIRYDACHGRNWTDSYLIKLAEQAVGYISVKGLEDLQKRNTIFEFYLLPYLRNKASLIFKRAIEASKVSYLESQSNDFLMTSMLYEFGSIIRSDTILFGEGFNSKWSKEGLIFRKYNSSEEVFGKKESDKGSYVLEKGGRIVADGGFLTHYNPPFADLYMEVEERHRGKGYAAFILQEIKKECYLAGRVPAARCSIKNPASKGALLKAGMQVVGYMLKAEIS